MKKFICTLPLQPNADGNVAVRYNYDLSCGFEYDGEVRNPVIPFILNHTDPGETIGIYLIVEEKSVATEAGETHLKNLTAEYEDVKAAVGFNCDGIKQITICAPQDSREYMRLVKKLFGIIEDGDEIYADVTYGRKAVPIAQFIALTFAYKIRKNVEIGALSYGEYHNPGIDGKTTPTVFDLADFFLLSDLISNLGARQEAGNRAPMSLDEAEKVIKSIVDELTGGEC